MRVPVAIDPVISLSLRAFILWSFWCASVGAFLGAAVFYHAAL